MSLEGRELILGVTGSIAAYKAVYLLRELTRLGALVTVCLSEHAREFLGPLTFRTLSGRAVLSNLFDPQSADAVEHVALAERAHAVLVAPATANVLAKAAHGIADDFLTTLLLAARAPVLMVPAMDGGMWEHAAVAANVATLRRRGVTVLEPDTGALASGLRGKGRFPEIEDIVEAVRRMLAPVRDLTGERLLVTAGPTREPIDPVRYISNRSSGKMGYGLATAALRRGAEVTLVSGPTALTPPPGSVFVPVQTAEEMREAVLHHLDRATIVVKAAAVADYRARHASSTKIKGKRAITAISGSRTCRPAATICSARPRRSALRRRPSRAAGSASSARRARRSCSGRAIRARSWSSSARGRARTKTPRAFHSLGGPDSS